MKLKLLKWQKKHGYLSWRSVMDSDMKKILPKEPSALFTIIFFGREIPNRRVDWKRRRISLGKNKMKKVRVGSTLEISRFGKKIIVK